MKGSKRSASKDAASGATLLEHATARGALETSAAAPLAERMRPRALDEIVGQSHVLGPGQWLRKAIEGDRFPSLVLWGPPGVGKTTIARVLAEVSARRFVPFSAVLGGVPELRTLLAEAEENRRFRGIGTVLFVDELHRFNRGQQDAFLPHVERGSVTLVGATTENPSFSVNAAVLSRATVVHLQALELDDLVFLLQRALSDEERGLGKLRLTAPRDVLSVLARAADGDARRALGLLELAVGGARTTGPGELRLEDLDGLVERSHLLHDKAGDQHYDLTSAFIKSLRGSDPDASVYWMMRLLEAGEDPLFLLRRMLVFASEDVGNADPRALSLVVAADQAFRRMGLPEGYYPLTHACLFLAACPKSGAVGPSFQKARADVQAHGSLPVPKKLRNAPTQLARAEGHAADYRYPHDFAEGFAPGETYLPEALVGVHYYQPTAQGLERSIAERLRLIEAARKTGD